MRFAAAERCPRLARSGHGALSWLLVLELSLRYLAHRLLGVAKSLGNIRAGRSFSKPFEPRLHPRASVIAVQSINEARATISRRVP